MDDDEAVKLKQVSRTYHMIGMDDDEAVKLKQVSRTYHMIGGDGPNSYANNSDYQKQVIASADKLIRKLINDHLNPPPPPDNTIRIADFGSSVGPNAFLAVQNIISAVRHKYEPENRTPEFQVFFNDLVGNDFNMLFRNLPRDYFACGSPGSFHARLFPERTLHLAHCSTSLHWMSRVPHEVAEEGSGAWNKGSLHYSGGGKRVKEAYWGRYKEDMGGFLRARAEELVDGGLMVLVVLGFPEGGGVSESSIGVAFEILGSCLRDMAKTGKISGEKVDSFNLPFYYPSPSELKDLVQENGSFDIERMVDLGGPMRDKPDPEILSRHLRAVIGVLIEQHFGDERMMDELFRHHYEKLVESPILVQCKYWKETNLLVFLKRKPRMHT